MITILMSFSKTSDLSHVNETTILEGINDDKSRCDIDNCNKTCGLLHRREICECLEVYDLTKDMNKTLRLAYRMKNDFRYGCQKEIKIRNTKFNSSGVLLFSNDLIYLFRNSNVVLGKNRGEYYCGMTKGRIDSTDTTLEKTATRELYEESCKTIFIPKECLNGTYKNYVDATDYNKTYRIYFCELPDDFPNFKSMYLSNLDNIEDSENNIKYHETDNLFVFNINEIIDKIKDKQFYKLRPEKFHDTEGNLHFIDRKTIQVIYKYYMDKKEKIKLGEYNFKNIDTIQTFNFIIP